MHRLQQQNNTGICQYVTLIITTETERKKEEALINAQLNYSNKLRKDHIYNAFVLIVLVILVSFINFHRCSFAHFLAPNRTKCPEDQNLI